MRISIIKVVSKVDKIWGSRFESDTKMTKINEEKAKGQNKWRIRINTADSK